jgi:hypothetical protein
MTIKNLIIAFVATFSSLAQTSDPFQPRTIYVVHSATRRTPQTPEAGLAPGSLCDINVIGLYQQTGALAQGDRVTLFSVPP